MIEIADIDEFRLWEAHEIEFCETLASQAAMTRSRPSSSSGSATWPTMTR